MSDVTDILLEDELSEEDAAHSSAVSSFRQDGGRSAFSPYRPTTVLTNLQRGNIQTQTPVVFTERSIHQLAAQGELFLQSDREKFDVDEKDEKGYTPLMWASMYGQLATVQNLLKEGAQVSLIANSGSNALIHASNAGHAAIIKELISHGADLNYQDKDGNTALMYAAFLNHANCVQELLSAGADITIVNEIHESAYDIVIKKRSKNAQAVMEKHMLNLLTGES